MYSMYYKTTQFKLADRIKCLVLIKAIIITFNSINIIIIIIVNIIIITRTPAIPEVRAGIEKE